MLYTIFSYHPFPFNLEALFDDPYIDLFMYECMYHLNGLNYRIQKGSHARIIDFQVNIVGIREKQRL